MQYSKYVMATETTPTDPTPTGPKAEEIVPPRPVDELLQIEDPAFAASMDELRAQVEQDKPEISQLDIESLDLEEKPLTKWAAFRSKVQMRVARLRELLTVIIHALKNFRVTAIIAAKATLLFLKHAAKATFAWTRESIKSAIKGFKALPLSSKLLVFATLILGIVTVFVMRMVMRGNYLPTIEMHYLQSFSDVADESFTFDAHEPIEDFRDPIFHPEHVMLIDKIIVNLKRPSENTNPMGLFEFYIEVSTDEAAVELKDREVETRDLISRTIEQMTYEDLVTAEGKNKLKIILRKGLNDFVTKGRVRSVLFRNIVLKE